MANTPFNFFNPQAEASAQTSSNDLDLFRARASVALRPGEGPVASYHGELDDEEKREIESLFNTLFLTDNNDFNDVFLFHKSTARGYVFQHQVGVVATNEYRLEYSINCFIFSDFKNQLQSYFNSPPESDAIFRFN